TGVDVAGQNALQRWNDYGFGDVAHPIALTGTSPDAAVVGVGVARVLQLCGALRVRGCAPGPHILPAEQGRAMPGDIAALSQASPAANRRSRGAQDPSGRRAPRIDLLAATARGAPNVASLSVVKAVEKGAKAFDDVYVELHLARAQRLVYGGDPPEVTGIILQLRHTAQIPAARARLEQLLATTLKDHALEVHDFKTLQPYYGQVVAFFSAIFGFMAILIGVIVLFTVSNTMSMAVLERTPEIGTLRAIGLRRAGVRRIFLCEGLLLGLAGSALGVLAALALAALINHSGLTWAPPGRIDRVPLRVRLWGDITPLIAVTLGLTAIAVVSSWIPARRGARTHIVAALRHA
ncbi:MAG: ABC transporter permease, partial [Steroidobacteraceae bacterium]